MRPWPLAVTVLAATVLGLPFQPAADAADTVPVTTCGQHVQGSGVLTGDLDCSATSGPAVVLEGRSKLDLAGFTLTATDTGVQCGIGRCKVVGPGTIRRPVFEPFTNAAGITAATGIRVSGGVVLQNWRFGMYSLGSALVSDLTASDNEIGVLGGPVRVADSTFTNNHWAVRASEGTKDGIHYIFGSCRVVRSSFSGNVVDIGSYRPPRVFGSTCTTSDILTIPDAPFSGGDEWGVCS